MTPPYGSRHFFELPIYRCSEDDFNRQYKKDLNERLQPLAESISAPPEDSAVLRNAEQNFWENYGGPWRYNQLVGWLQLYVGSDQIRGELWEVNAKRVERRMRHKQMRPTGKAFEIYCFPEDTSADILERVRGELAQFQKRFRGGRFTLDTECFDNTARALDWRALVKPSSATPKTKPQDRP